MAVPFGPFLAAGAMLALWCGPAMIDWYSGRL
jgi:prepilin signal peptidase PulO-like enzyme (type II secretory pathway)